MSVDDRASADNHSADDREALLDERELRLGSAESAAEARDDLIHRIVAAAEQRDNEADERDCVADQRDEAASLESFIDVTSDYDTVNKNRQSAAIDRQNSKTDRTSSAIDRSELIGTESAAQVGKSEP